MNLPSFFHLTPVTTVFKRFPWVMAASLVGTWAGLITLHDDLQRAYGLSEAQAVKLAMTAFLGISLLVSLALVGERGRSGWSRHLLQAAGALLLLAYYLSIDEGFKDDTWLRYWMHFAASHLLVTFAPFLRDSRPRAYWQFNLAIFLRIILSFFFSHFLWALGLVFVSKLSLHISSKPWGDLFFLTYGVFNTWFFLAGVPQDFHSMERKDGSPGKLEFLSRYVLIPLVCVSVVIQYVYMVTILVDVGRGGVWPETRVDFFFLPVSLCGILSLLLLDPVSEEKETPRVRFFRRWFHPAQWPLQIFLVAVLAHEVFRLGLAEETYRSLVLALWIAGMAAYFTLGKGKSTKAIPITLFLLCLLFSFGPWGVIALPAKDQVRHLEKLMAAHGLLQDGRYVPVRPGQSLPENDRERIRDILIYLDGYGGLDIIRHRLPPDAIGTQALSHFSQLAGYLRLDESPSENNTPPPMPSSCRTYAFHRGMEKGIFGLGDYSFLIKDFKFRDCDTNPRSITTDFFPGQRKLDRIEFRCRDNTALITLGGQPLSIPMEKVMAGLEARSPSVGECNGGYTYTTFPEDSSMMVEGENGRMKAAVQVLYLVWEKDSSARRLRNIEFDLLFGYKGTRRSGPIR